MKRWHIITLMFAISIIVYVVLISFFTEIVVPDLTGIGEEISENDKTVQPSETSPVQTGEDKPEQNGDAQGNNDENGTGSEEPIIRTENEIILEELKNYEYLSYFKDENTDRYVIYKKNNPDLPYEKVITYVNIGLDHDFYENVKIAKNINSITVLVNKYNKLPDDFEPELVRLDHSYCAEGRGPQYLRKEAADAFIKMCENAKKFGLKITAYGTYRSIRTQHRIWNNAVRSGRSIEDVDNFNSRGGHSEHHTGLAVDVIKNNYSVEKTKEFEWYSKNAHKYGFIIRYPRNKEHITGYKYEPWHLRYVGDIAEKIYESGLTYDEYYVTVIEPE